MRRFSCLGLGLGKPTCTPNHAWRDLCGQMWVRVFCGQKGGREGGGVQCSAAAGRTIRTVLDDTRCVTSVPPTTLWTVVVDVPVLFRAGFPALLRAAEYNPRLVFFSPCASVAGAPRSCMHDGERQTFFIDARSNFPLFCIHFCLFATVCRLDMLIELVHARVSRFFCYVHVVEQLAVFELRRIQNTRVN